jgi:IS30 family transposase
LKRNKHNGVYSGEIAINLTVERRRRERATKFTEIVKGRIVTDLKNHWSPEQISGRLKKDKVASISHELIYQYIDKDRKAGGILYTYLPHRGKKYKKRNLKTRRKVWKTAKPRTSISERPSKVSAKKEALHWEGDTVESKGHSGGVATLVEMKTKYTLIKKVEDKSAETMKNVIIKSFIKCPGLIRSLTLDNGTEFALHDLIAKELNTVVYFANPYSPWQRGLNENTNGLLRRFYPKGTDFNKVSERELLKTQDMLNNRPRKCLGYRTPNEVFLKEVLKNQAHKLIA